MDFNFVVGWDDKVHFSAGPLCLLTITISGLLARIRWTVCISKYQKSLCFLFWFVHIPFGCMVQFKFLAEFPIDHFLRPVLSSLVHFLCKFAVFVYYVINCFVFTITKPTLLILLRLIEFRFYILDSNGVVLSCDKNRFSFSLKDFFLELFPSLFVRDFACLSLEMFRFGFFVYWHINIC